MPRAEIWNRAQVRYMLTVYLLCSVSILQSTVPTILRQMYNVDEPPPTPTKSVYELLDITNDKLGVVDLIYDQLMEMKRWLMATFGGLRNQQCYVYETEYDGDRLSNPIFEGEGFIGTYTLDECWAHCATDFDSKGRPCVAIEWSDGGLTQSSTTTKDCALAWGCDYTEYWSGGSVYQMISTGLVTQPPPLSLISAILQSTINYSTVHVR